MSKDMTFNECLSEFRSGTQVDVMERSLKLICEVGDSKSQTVAEEALRICSCIPSSVEGTSLPKAKTKKRTVTRKVSSKAKNKPSPKPGRRVHKVTIVSPSNGAMSLNGNSTTAGRLLAWRKGESLSQKKAAERASVSISSWQAWEAGKWPPGEEMLKRLEKLGV